MKEFRKYDQTFSNKISNKIIYKKIKNKKLTKTIS